MGAPETAAIKRHIDEDGFLEVRGVLDDAFIARAKAELLAAIEREVEYHGTRDYSDYGMVLLCSLYGGAFLELFENERLLAPIEAVLGEGSIVYAYTSSSMPPASTNYSRRIHVDCPRLIPGYTTNVGATILLDDFTEENGAMYYVPGSHTRADAPTEDAFYRDARRLVAPRGTVFFFNARLWHAGGKNETGAWRHALTLNMCRPYMKQRLDIPRAMNGMDLAKVPERTLQKLGFLAQVPASYDEYYAPPALRKFRQRTE